MVRVHSWSGQEGHMGFKDKTGSATCKKASYSLYYQSLWLHCIHNYCISTTLICPNSFSTVLASVVVSIFLPTLIETSVSFSNSKRKLSLDAIHSSALFFYILHMSMIIQCLFSFWLVLLNVEPPTPFSVAEEKFHLSSKLSIISLCINFTTSLSTHSFLSTYLSCLYVLTIVINT